MASKVRGRATWKVWYHCSLERVSLLLSVTIHRGRWFHRKHIFILNVRCRNHSSCPLGGTGSTQSRGQEGQGRLWQPLLDLVAARGTSESWGVGTETLVEVQGWEAAFSLSTESCESGTL